MATAPLSCVVFDLEGTLIFPKKALPVRVADAMHAEGVDLTSAEVARALGRAYRTSVENLRALDAAHAHRAFGEQVPADVIDRALARLAAGAKDPECWRVAPDAYAVLGALRFLGIRTVLLCDLATAEQPFLEALGLPVFFDRLVFCGDKGGHRKPDRRAFAAVLRAEQLPLGAVMMAGDSPADDAESALAAGMRACLVGGDPQLKPSGAYHAAVLSELVGHVRGEFVVRLERKGFSRPVRNMVADFRGLPHELGRSVEKSMTGTHGIADLLRRACDGETDALRGVANLARGALVAEESGLDTREILLDSWPTLIVPRLRDKCFPIELDRDALVILCVSPVARNELKFVERALITAVRRLPGCSGVNKIVCRM